MGKLRVTVLSGGTSSEREVCLMSGRRVLQALDPTRYDAQLVDLADITDGRASGLAAALLSSSPAPARSSSEPAVETANGRPDVVFIALHGGAGENGTVQGMLELLGVPYVGSGVLASALAMNKVMAKRIFEREEVPTPKWVVARASERTEVAQRVASFVGAPCIVKPVAEGSTIGITLVHEASQLLAALETAWRYGPEALIEEFIAGTEITGPVLGNDDARVLPLVEIVPKGGFYDYEAKYTPGATEEIVPARIPENIAARARELTLRAHHALGCRGISRVDMIATADEVYVLEVNTIPGLTETSLVPRAAEAEGMSFSQLVSRLIELALEDRGGGRHGRGA
ncbi:MAG: D-alanine--D-alanine ligase [Armatimonadetes bacterium]|nr:D-alanine--D-alanine ligase [Armatimonadota bacterium]